MLEKNDISFTDKHRQLINQAYRADEREIIEHLLSYASLSKTDNHAIHNEAIRLVKYIRKAQKNTTGIESFLAEYSLSSEEGIALMCLAEALLRVPDNVTIDSLIKDKLTTSNWAAHLGKSDSFFVNAATWALILTGKCLSPERGRTLLTRGLLKLTSRGSESVIRRAVDKAMRIMNTQFVMGKSIEDALMRAKVKEQQGFCYSYDCLGEAALTEDDAKRYFADYQNAIKKIGQFNNIDDISRKPGISVKLSALHPRYQEAQRARVLTQLTPKLLALAQLAKKHDISFTIDAEESERLDISLDIIAQVFQDKSLAGWQGFGIAVQAYQKRAFYVLDWLAALARSQQKRINVRLIKGAYWDSEIKKTQMQGLKQYSVFTRKSFTDVSFQACAKKMLTLTDAIYPQFATHNAYSVATILTLAKDYRDFEFQCLHGMGQELYQEIVKTQGMPCRIYAPVGVHEDLLPYLVRRLLENGANSSFVNRVVDEHETIDTLTENPLEKSRLLLDKINQNIVLPKDIFAPMRLNSSGIDLNDRQEIMHLKASLQQVSAEKWHIKTAHLSNTAFDKSYAPQKPDYCVGSIIKTDVAKVEDIILKATKAFQAWSVKPVGQRADCLNRYADLLEAHQTELFALLMLEAGKTWRDCVAEVREAVDFCRYYAAMAIELMSEPRSLKGYTGELNELSLHPRGIILCISPWNFPLAIFTGQIVAALVTGHCVLAKPAEQTPLIARKAIELMYQAGIEDGVVQLLIGSGRTLGQAFVAHAAIKGVLFTGSNQTATHINQTLAARGGEIIPLIAETGGQNVMIVDSSALLEQVVVDVIDSAFGSAGQRCSALRVVYIQEDIYARFVSLLKGAMAELCVGDPRWLATDVGPVIDKASLDGLMQHVALLSKQYDLIYQCKLSDDIDEKGYYMPPTAIAIESIETLTKEVFGPILHVIKFKWKNLESVINEINGTGFGLTLGIHSRINHRVDAIKKRVHVGNCYVNRNMTGAVVGLQPFGGEGLSGTGPKAGGPFYLQRLCLERTYTVDTTAAGGNASLMSLTDEI